MTAVTRRRSLLLTAMILAAMETASSVQAETAVGKRLLSGEVELGLRAISGDDWSSAKYEEYREQRPGLFGNARLLLEDPDSGRYLRALLRDVGERDERYELELGRYGRSRLQAWYGELPHNWSNHGLTFFDPGTDEELVLGPLTSAPLRTRLRDGGVGLRIRTGRPWELEVDYRMLERRGTMPWSIGFGNPGDNFLNFARPVDETTHEVNAAGRWIGDGWNLEAGYTGSWFRNEIDRLVVPNFATSSTFGLAPEGQLSMAPDNGAHTFRLSGGADLPLAFPARIAGTVAYGWREQDDDFLCHTINDAIIGSRFARDDCPLVAENPIAGSFALPEDSLNGSIDTFLGNVVLTARPLRPLRITARYRIYDYNNDTSELRFIDHVENDTFATVDDARISVANSYRRHNASVEASLRVRKGLRLRTTYLFEQWERSGDRSVRKLDEHGGRIRLDWRPHARWQVRAGYEFGVRRGNGYDPFAHLRETVDVGGLSPAAASARVFPELRKYDQANRQRDRFDLDVHVSPTEAVTLGVFGRYEQIVYDDSDFGLLGDERLAVGGDLSWQLSDRVQLSSWYTFEDIKFEMQSRFRPRSFAAMPMIVDVCTPPARPDCNDWDGLQKDQVHNVGMRLDVALVPKLLDLALRYEFQHATAKSRADNDGVPQGIGFFPGTQGVATNYPGVGDVSHRLEASLAYHVSESLTTKLFYGYERFDLTDFRIDDLTVFGPMRPGETDVFLGERIDDYHAHIFGVSILYRF